MTTAGPLRSRRSSKAAPSRPPLEQEILATGPLRERSKKRKSREFEEDGTQGYVDAKSSKRILAIGRQLAKEDDERSGDQVPSQSFALDSRALLQPQSDSDSDNGIYPQEETNWLDDEGNNASDSDLTQAELAAFNRFIPPASHPLLDDSGDEDPPVEGSGTDLTTLILAKIAAHEAQQQQSGGIRPEGVPSDAVELPAKAVEVYEKVGLLLSRYKSGKLPKPFKILPTLPNWESYLHITKPANWTPNACYEATRIFVSRKPYQTQYFIREVLLDRVKEDIRETKKLNVHLFGAIKKALYKPAAFFKGFLFPLVAAGTCTLREAHIISSALVRVSIPVLHSAAALLKLCEIAAELSILTGEAGGAVNIFIRALLDKKYALPYKVIDALVFHFLRFKGIDQQDSMNVEGEEKEAGRTKPSEARLPVLWHQSLLIFAQRHRNDVTEDQREALLDLLLVKGHSSIGPEVRRELLAGRGRGVLAATDEKADGDDTLMLVDS